MVHYHTLEQRVQRQPLSRYMLPLMGALAFSFAGYSQAEEPKTREQYIAEYERAVKQHDLSTGCRRLKSALDLTSPTNPEDMNSNTPLLAMLHTRLCYQMADKSDGENRAIYLKDAENSLRKAIFAMKLAKECTMRPRYMGDLHYLLALSESRADRWENAYVSLAYAKARGMTLDKNAVALLATAEAKMSAQGPKWKDGAKLVRAFEQLEATKNNALKGNSKATIDSLTAIIGQLPNGDFFPVTQMRAEAHMWLLAAYYDANRLADASTEVGDITAMQPAVDATTAGPVNTQAVAYLNDFKSAIAKKQPTPAANALNQALRADPQNAVFQLMVSDALLDLKRPAEAVTAAKRALILDPLRIASLERLAAAHDQLKEAATAANKPFQSDMEWSAFFDQTLLKICPTYSGAAKAKERLEKNTMK